MDMEIKKIVDLGTDENCYILYSGKSCAVIDPGENYEKALEFIRENNLKIEKILLTHCHYDHSAGAGILKKETGAPVAASEECKENIKYAHVNVSALFGHELKDDIVDEILTDGEEFYAAGIKFTCIKTPGHTSCSVCYITEDIIFTGDTLFYGSVGRWDLPTGNFEELVSSIKEKLYKMDNMRVYPGHGEETSIEKERLYNSCICL